MRVFIAGATGAIGRRLVPMLTAAGHDVTGMTRSARKSASIEAAGGSAVVCDVYDRGALIDAVRNCGAEVVIHLLTDLPARMRPRAATTSTDRLRRAGTRNLLEAARSAGARQFIAESIAFLYRPNGDAPCGEQDPPWLDAPGSFAESIGAVVDLERQVIEAPALEGTVLRFGWLYGPGTWYAPDGSIGRDVRRRLHPIVGEGSGRWSFVHVDDAAGAVVGALTASSRPVAAAAGGRAGIYNVVDDEPAPMRDWLPAFAEALGAPAPLRIPAWLARVAAGPVAIAIASGLAGASNARAKRELGWTLRYPSWRTGFRTGLKGPTGQAVAE